jgi:Ca-activated chloride channel family protein
MLLDKPVNGPVEKSGNESDNLRFTAAVAEFGLILRGSEFKGSATLESAINLAGMARGEDEEGYRAEFIRLIKTVKEMRLLSDKE